MELTASPEVPELFSSPTKFIEKIMGRNKYMMDTPSIIRVLRKSVKVERGLRLSRARMKEILKERRRHLRKIETLQAIVCDHPICKGAHELHTQEYNKISIKRGTSQ